MLRSIVALDQDIVNRICEAAEDERNVTLRLRRTIRTALKKLLLPKADWHKTVEEKFTQYASSNGLSANQFNLFLHSLQIFLTEPSRKELFNVLDFDEDGRLTWETINPIIFPEALKRNIKIKKKRRSIISHGNQDKDDLNRHSTDDGMIFEYSIAGRESGERPSELGRRSSLIQNIRRSIVNSVYSSGMTLQSSVSGRLFQSVDTEEGNAEEDEPQSLSTTADNRRSSRKVTLASIDDELSIELSTKSKEKLATLSQTDDSPEPTLMPSEF